MVRGGLHLAAPAVALLAAAVLAGSAQAESGCAARVMNDWRDGRISHSYPVDCYREALQSLPEDLRIYSSAASDITRALQARVRTVEPEAAAAKTSSGGGGGISPYLVAAISLALALAGASVVTLRH
jgi:hypothetical protein